MYYKCNDIDYNDDDVIVFRVRSRDSFEPGSALTCTANNLYIIIIIDVIMFPQIIHVTRTGKIRFCEDDDDGYINCN